jgi:hypothetical protein
MDLSETWQVVDWIHPAQRWDQWRDVVNMALNLRPVKARAFLDQASDFCGFSVTTLGHDVSVTECTIKFP